MRKLVTFGSVFLLGLAVGNLISVGKSAPRKAGAGYPEAVEVWQPTGSDGVRHKPRLMQVHRVVVDGETIDVGSAFDADGNPTQSWKLVHITGGERVALYAHDPAR